MNAGTIFSINPGLSDLSDSPNTPSCLISDALWVIMGP